MMLQYIEEGNATSRKYVDSNGTLVITVTTQSNDEGNYTCVATSPAGGPLNPDGLPTSAKANIKLIVSMRKSTTACE